MKIITGGINGKKRVLIVLTLLAVLGSLTVLFSTAYQKSRQSTPTGTKGGYLYDIYGQSTDGGEGKDDSEDSADGLLPTLPIENRHTVLFLGRDYDSNRTDAVVCISFDFKAGTVSTLQIPRDTYINSNGYTGRLNGLLPRYRGQAIEDGAADPTDAGIKSLIKHIKTDFGVHCNSYIFMDSNAVATITDALGGVKLDIPTDIDYTDTARGIDLHLKAGTQTLNGTQASQFVRYRKGYPQSDIGRINAQKLYVAAMLEKLQGYASATAAVKLVEALAGTVKTNLTPEEILRLATALCTVSPSDVVMYTLPGDGVTVNGGSYYGVFAAPLASILENGFGTVLSVGSLGITDFSHQAGGYRDTQGITLASVIQNGISIPVYGGTDK